MNRAILTLIYITSATYCVASEKLHATSMNNTQIKTSQKSADVKTSTDKFDNNKQPEAQKEPQKETQQENQNIIVVTASPSGRSAMEMATPVLVLGEEELVSKRGINIAETLALEPGVSASSFGSGAGRPVIRGLSGARVKVLQNGISTLDASATSPDHAITSEPLLANQIEILKGPVTLLYGGSAIGGVINVVDNRIPEKAPEELIQGAIEARYGSAAEEKSGVARLDIGHENWAMHVNAYQRESGDIELPSSLGSTLLNSNTESDGATIGGAWIFEDKGLIGLSISNENNEYGLPATDASEEFVRIKIDQKRTDAKLKLSEPFRGVEELKVRYGHTDYQHVELEGEETGTLFDNNAHEARFEILHTPVKDWLGIVGMQTNKRDFSAIGEEAFVPPSITRSLDWFITEEKSFNDLTLELGVRSGHQKINTDNPGINSNTPELQIEHNTFSFSFNALWKLNARYSLSAALTRAQRAPDAEELLSDGLHLATQSYILGDQTLDKETSNNLNVAFKQYQGNTTFTFNLFYNRFNQFVYEQARGEIIDELPVYQFVQEDAVFKGFEFDIDWIISDSKAATITLRGQADYVNGKLTSGDYLPRMSPLRFGGGLSYEKNDYTINFDAIRSMKQENISEYETATPGHTLVNLELNYRLTSDKYEHLLFLKATNLLDEEIINHMSFIKDIAPEAGRSFSAGVRFYF